MNTPYSCSKYKGGAAAKGAIIYGSSFGLAPFPTGQTVIYGKGVDLCGTPKAEAWGIPPETLHKLCALTETAEAALTAAKNETTRTPVATAQCREAFDGLTAKMRDMKKRYFLSPPLTEADFISLGLKPYDPTHTPSGVPTAQVRVETFLMGRHELGVKIVYVTGTPSDPANKGFRIYYRVVGPGETPPVNPKDLRESFFTKRKKDLIEFDYGDSGKTAYFAVQIENQGKKGNWGPMESGLIP
jgi:hypothetical protein